MANIYALKCPKTGEVRYVGKANDLEARLKSHIESRNTSNSPVKCWIRSLVNDGLKPEMVMLEANCDDWQSAERRHIFLARKKSKNLLNVCDGGNEPPLFESGDAKRITDIKRTLMQMLGRGYVSEKTKVKMRALYKKDPATFKCFAGV